MDCILFALFSLCASEPAPSSAADAAWAVTPVPTALLPLPPATFATARGPQVQAWAPAQDRDSRWVEGGIIGSAAGIVGALLLKSAADNHREVSSPGSRTIVVVSGGAVGFLVGALIGQSISK